LMTGILTLEARLVD